jgi:type IV secretory pathway ATPase VirB11/archaellum biosynthesis ATPase
MAIDDADGSDPPELQGAVDSAESDATVDPDPATVGEYTWADFLEEYGAPGDADALYRDREAGPENARWDDESEEPAPLTEADWDRVDLDVGTYLGFHPLDTEPVLAEGNRRGEKLQERFEAFCDPETTPVVKDEWIWEHYKREYYYEEDGSRPRTADGEIDRFDPAEALGFDPSVIEDALSRGADRARELDDLVEERTVNVREDFEEDDFFSTAEGATTLTNRYDLEKAVPMAKKLHFREEERYWVNKPYSFVVIFHSTKENEKKYYLIEPYTTQIESDLTEFMEGKLRTAIKYSEEGVVGADEDNRRGVIESEAMGLFERYDLYDPPSTGGSGSRLASLLGLDAAGDDAVDGSATAERGDGFASRLANRLGLGGGAGGSETPATAAVEDPSATADDDVESAPAGDAEEGDSPSADAADADSVGDERGSGPRDADPGADATDLAVYDDDGAADAEADLPADVDAQPPAEVVDDEFADAGEATAPRETGTTDESGAESVDPDGEDPDAATEPGEDPEAEADDSPGDDAADEAPDGRNGSRFAGLSARIRSLLGLAEDVDEEDPNLDGISARPEPAVVADDSEELSEYQVEKLLYFLKRDFIGYERIDGIKHDINVEDISCDGYNSPVFVYHGDYEQIITNVYHGKQELDDFVVKLAQRSGKGISKRQPQVDATLPDGSRAQLTLGVEVSDHGTNYTIRQFKDVPFTPIDLINWNTFSLEEMGYLWLCIENNKSLIFAGGTASGKTTSLNAVSLFIPSNSKIVSIEDTREVELPQRNWIASVTRPSFTDDDKGDVDEFDLLEAALRQRPDYIVMGEIRGEEGRTLFQVMSTGHTTYTTFHADSVGEVLKRFTTDPINVSKTMFTALDLVSIQSSTRVGGKKVRRNKALTEINHYDAENDEINVQDVYQWQAETDEFLKMGSSNTLEDIKFDRGWTQSKLETEMFKRQVVLAYLIDRGLNTYTQVAATFQAFINDQETILSLMATDRLEKSLEDLREMESVLIDIDPDKEEMVPRPDPGDEIEELAADILARAEETLFPEYRDGETGDVASALSTVGPAADVPAEPGEGQALGEADAGPGLDAGESPASLDAGTDATPEIEESAEADDLAELLSADVDGEDADVDPDVEDLLSGELLDDSEASEASESNADAAPSGDASADGSPPAERETADAAAGDAETAADENAIEAPGDADPAQDRENSATGGGKSTTTEDAETTAESAETTAESAETTAESAETTAEGAETTAEDAETTAEGAETTAEGAGAADSVDPGGGADGGRSRGEATSEPGNSAAAAGPGEDDGSRGGDSAGVEQPAETADSAEEDDGWAFGEFEAADAETTPGESATSDDEAVDDEAVDGDGREDT